MLRRFATPIFTLALAMPLDAAITPTLGPVLEPIRAKYDLPALAGAIFTVDGVTEIGVTGVRKRGDPTPTTVDDLWHLGSDTKMMTATLAGTYVAEKRLSWDDKVISFFPEIADKVPPAIKGITVSQMLSHQAGLSENLSRWSLLFLRGTMIEQRLTASQWSLESPAYPSGTFHYANNDYIVMGAILEKIGGKPWEDLIRERIFTPLHMDSAGFGGTSTTGLVDQPWPHYSSGSPAFSNGPEVDNAAYVGPAGRVHCSMNDWARFLIDQLRGSSGMPALLPHEIYQAMQTNHAGENEYGFGWAVVNRPWADGLALSHNGSNTMNYSVCWLAPAKKFGVLVCCNQGGEKVPKACDDAASALIERYLAKP